MKKLLVLVLLAMSLSSSAFAFGNCNRGRSCEDAVFDAGYRAGFEDGRRSCGGYNPQPQPSYAQCTLYTSSGSPFTGSWEYTESAARQSAYRTCVGYYSRSNAYMCSDYVTYSCQYR